MSTKLIFFYFKAPGAAGKTGSLGKKPGESCIVAAPYICS